MNHKQAFVFRGYVANEAAAEKVCDILDNMGIKNDYIKSRREEPDKWKFIFVEQNMPIARLAADKLKEFVSGLDYFDPEKHDWFSGLQRYQE